MGTCPNRSLCYGDQLVLNILCQVLYRKSIMCQCGGQKIHSIRWRLRVASVCILVYRGAGFYC